MINNLKALCLFFCLVLIAELNLQSQARCMDSHYVFQERSGKISTLLGMEIPFTVENLDVNKNFSVLDGADTVLIYTFMDGWFYPRKGYGIPCEVEVVNNSSDISIKASYPNVVGMVWMFEQTTKFDFGSKKYVADKGATISFTQEGIKFIGVNLL